MKVNPFLWLSLMLLDWDIEHESYRNPQASNWASKKSREFKAYVRGKGEFGDVGFESQGKEKTEVQHLSLFRWKCICVAFYCSIYLRAVI